MERRNSMKRRNTGLFSSYKGFLPPSFLLNTNGGMANINSRRGNIPLTFIPPSTKSPLFIYNNDCFDKRSFLSLCSPSHLHAVEEEEGALEDDVDGGHGSDMMSVSTARSLPSTLTATDDDLESIRTWLDNERERRSLAGSSMQGSRYYGAVDDDDDDEVDILEEADRLFRHESYNSSLLKGEEVPQGDEEESEDFEHEVTSVNHETGKLVRYSIPLILTFFLEQVFSVVCLVFVGHLGKEELAAVSMASMTSTIVLAIFEGVSTALDTLCPQAYGAGQFAQVGIHCQRCSLFSLTLFIPAALFWFYSGSILKYVIESETVVRLTQLFLRILILGGPPYILFENGKRFLQAQGIFDAGTYILTITAPINVFLNWLLVYSDTCGLGYIGSPIASRLLTGMICLYWLFLE
ncbi:unnamed protein product [Ambrosiozyma monospora]|uniref:Unnamed protein product n=1 Tax=Ambrosiozyma monospora TaxID=43982 RepID=A0A9W7DIK4_AMBMO|nr:unnamed protein product [Ambrosiozyma monospora]